MTQTQPPQTPDAPAVHERVRVVLPSPARQDDGSSCGGLDCNPEPYAVLPGCDCDGTGCLDCMRPVDVVDERPDEAATLRARLNAIAAYTSHPGNWSSLDSRRRLLHDLATGALDPNAFDFSNTNLPPRGSVS